MRMGRSVSGPILLLILCIHTARVLAQHGSGKVWLSLLLETHQEMLLGVHAVKRGIAVCPRFTLCYIPTKIPIKTQQETESTEPQKLINGLQVEHCWLWAGEQVRQVFWGFTPQTSHNGPPSPDMGFSHWECKAAPL